MHNRNANVYAIILYKYANIRLFIRNVFINIQIREREKKSRRREERKKEERRRKQFFPFRTSPAEVL